MLRKLGQKEHEKCQFVTSMGVTEIPTRWIPTKRWHQTNPNNNSTCLLSVLSLGHVYSHSYTIGFMFPWCIPKSWVGEMEWKRVITKVQRKSSWKLPCPWHWGCLVARVWLDSCSLFCFVLFCLKQVAHCSTSTSIGYILGLNTVCFFYLWTEWASKMSLNECDLMIR